MCTDNTQMCDLKSQRSEGVSAGYLKVLSIVSFSATWSFEVFTSLNVTEFFFIAVTRYMTKILKKVSFYLGSEFEYIVHLRGKALMVRS